MTDMTDQVMSPNTAGLVLHRALAMMFWFGFYRPAGSELIARRRWNLQGSRRASRFWTWVAEQEHSQSPLSTVSGPPAGFTGSTRRPK